MSNFKKIRTKIKKIILDLIFPIKCLSCQKEGDWICKKCLQKFPRYEKQVCPICEKNITPLGAVCLGCKNKSFLDGIFVISPYSKPLVKKSLHYFKYRFIAKLSQPLAKIILEEFDKANFPIFDLILPVPLHSKKLRHRGFNQSELIAKYLAKNMATGFEINLSKNNLIRIKYSQSQMNLKNTAERKENVKNSFKIKNPAEITGKNILLIDDITTTGATLESCAQILKKGEAKSVFATVIARQDKY
jgi:ComF family protein